MRRHVLLILGMHRGGSSALAGALVKAGVHPGADQARPTADAPEGTFEDARIVAFNDDLLHSLGARWDSVVPLPEGWNKGPDIDARRAAFRHLFAEVCGDAKLIVVKDPRLPRLLPFWRAALDTAGTSVSCVLIIRRPMEVAASLARRDQFSPEKSLSLWFSHLVAAEQNSRGLPRALVTYDALLENWDGVLARVRAEAAFPLKISAAQREAIGAVVRPDLNRQRRAIAARPATAAGMASALDVTLEAGYTKLAALPPGSDPRAAVESLAAAAAPALSAAVPPWLAHELAATQAMAQMLAGESETARQSLEALASQVNLVREARSAGASAGDEPRSRPANRPTTLGEFTALGETLREEITGLASALASANAAQRDSHSQQIRAERELADERSTIAQLAAEIDIARSVRQQQDDEVALARRHVDEMIREIERARIEYAARDEEHLHRAQELEEIRGSVASLIADRDGLKRARDEASLSRSRLMAEADALRRDLLVRDSERAALTDKLEQSQTAIAGLSGELERRSAAERALLADRDRLGALEREAREHVAALESELAASVSELHRLRERLTLASGELDQLDQGWLGRLARRQSRT